MTDDSLALALREPGSSVAAALAGGNADLFKRLAGHRWPRALAAGTLPDTALIAWAQQRRLFCLMERPALMMIRALVSPGELDSLLAQLAEDTGREPQEQAVILAGRGAPVDVEPWPACLGYGSYVLGCARRGLLEGMTAVCAAKAAYLDTWTSVLPDAALDSPYRPWIQNWSSPKFSALAARLDVCLDQLAGPPSAETLQQLQPVYQSIMERELAFWDMAWNRQGWPGRDS